MKLITGSSEVVGEDLGFRAIVVDCAATLISITPTKANFRLLNLLLGAKRHLYESPLSSTEPLFTLSVEDTSISGSLEQRLLETKLDQISKSYSLSTVGVLLADAVINGSHGLLNTSDALVKLLQAIESANSAVVDSTICSSLQVYTNALSCGRCEASTEALLLTGVSSLIDLFLDQFEIFFRYYDV